MGYGSTAYHTCSSRLCAAELLPLNSLNFLPLVDPTLFLNAAVLSYTQHSQSRTTFYGHTVLSNSEDFPLQFLPLGSCPGRYISQAGTGHVKSYASIQITYAAAHCHNKHRFRAATSATFAPTKSSIALIGVVVTCRAICSEARSHIIHDTPRFS